MTCHRGRWWEAHRKLLTAALALGAVTGWCVARVAPEAVLSESSVLVLAVVLGLVPLGRRVLVRRD